MRRLLVAPLVLTAALALSQPAFATDYCVNTACSGTPKLTLEDALTAAGANDNADRIFLGQGLYQAQSLTGFQYNHPTAPVEIIGTGSGADRTILTSPLHGAGEVLWLRGGPGTSIHDVRISIPEEAGAGTSGLLTNGTANRIAVTADPNQVNYVTGVVLQGGTLENSYVEFAPTLGTYGVNFDDGGGGTVRDSGIDASSGIVSSYGGTIERTHIVAKDGGVFASRYATNIRSSIVDVEGATAKGIWVTNNSGIDTAVNIDGVTLVGPGTPGSYAINAATSSGPANDVDVTLRNSIIRGYGHTLAVGAAGPGHAHIVASYSDYDSAKNASASGAFQGITQSNISNVPDTEFNSDSIFEPLPSSSLIDAGDPAEPQGLDFHGNPLVTDGNGDGIARRDIGAVELPAASLPGLGDVPPAGSDPATGGDQSQIGGTSLGDTLAPLVSRFRTSHKVFAVGRAITAVSASVRGTRFGYTLSEPAKVVVKIQRVRNGRTIGKLVRSASAGANALRFSGRIGAKALRPGKYRAVITATDAAGNRSAPRRLSFQVVRG
jgi:hypothetical protein